MDIPAALDRFVHRARLDVLTPHAERRSRKRIPRDLRLGGFRFSGWIDAARSSGTKRTKRTTHRD